MLSIDDRGPTPICPENFNAAEYVLRAGLKTPDKAAIAVLGGSLVEQLTYAHLRQRVGAAQRWFASVGLVPGDVLLLRLGNSLDVPVAYLAAIAAGILPVPTSSALTDIEVTRLFQTLGPNAVLASPDVAQPSVPHRSFKLADMQSAPDAEPVPQMGDPNRPAYIMTTSGTSGSPRLVQHAHRAIWARYLMRDGWTEMRASDRVLHAGAFNWTYTLGTGLLDPWTIGATALIPAAGTDLAQLPDLLQQHDATLFAAVPGVYRKLLRTTLPRFPKLRHGLSAGEKLPETTRQAWRAATGTEIHEAFGQTEISTFLSGSPSRPAPTGTLGFVQPGRTLAILDRNAPVARETAGEIAIAANDPGLRLGRGQDKWVKTGDRGVMHRDGSITYLGRTDDTLTAGGYRISPLEIETAMSDMPGLTGIAVADVKVSGDIVVVGAYYTADTEIPDQSLADYAANRLAAYKCPRVWTRLSELPRNVNGKLLRRGLPGAKGTAP